MKYIIIILLLVSCTISEKTEVGCNCNEVKDKNITSHEYPYLYWDYELYVDYCDGRLEWVNVQQGQYNALNRGDCL